MGSDPGIERADAEGISPYSSWVEWCYYEMRFAVKRILGNKKRPLTEALKASDQMEWVRRMNSIQNRAEEIVLSELVFC